MSGAATPGLGAASDVETRLLRECLDAAAATRGRAAPNPRVGAAVLADGRVVGRGTHVFRERHHAEVVALAEAGSDARGGTLMVTLEPCSSHGRTPPCTEAIREAGISRVVIGCLDPDARHRGRGLARLREAGVEVAAANLAEEAVALNADYCCRQWLGRPLVTVKLAMSVDGGVAPTNRRSRWITGEEARHRVHEMRADAGAVLCGVGTVVADDPQLTPRLGQPAEAMPWRCVLDPCLRMPTTARLLAPSEAGGPGGRVLVFTAAMAGDAGMEARAEALRAAGGVVISCPAVEGGLDAGAALRHLAEDRGVLSVLVEGGGVTAGRLLAAGLVDRLVLHVAPMVLGGDGPLAAFAGFGAMTLDDAPRLGHLRARAVGEDLELTADVAGGFDPAALVAAARGWEGA